MAEDIVIRAEGLGKKYVIGHETERERYVALRDVVTLAARGVWRKAADMACGRAIVSGNATEEFWALKDVSFEVKRGEVLGIIGRNGAGKSTLLKILSRITEPSEGRITIKGRVASLLEVGTGFHPELTGRENIYLNGAILGMSRAEVNRKFDEIVAFAEIERFLDTPVKRYSSGMYVRLAFAVAAHLEPDILILDEVLAVGDVDFQRKCFGAIEKVARSDRTILLVSHNMAFVESLCVRGLLLNKGSVIKNDKIMGIIASYQNNAELDSESQRDLTKEASSPTQPHFTHIRLKNSAGHDTKIFAMGEDICVELDILAATPIATPWLGIQVRSVNRELISHVANRESGCDLPRILGRATAKCILQNPNLHAGVYYLDVILADALSNVYQHMECAFRLEIRSRDIYGTGIPMERGYGLCFLHSGWELVQKNPTIRDDSNSEIKAYPCP